MEEDVTDFKLIDDDFEEFMRRGREAFGIGEYSNSFPLPAPATNEEGEGSYGDHSQGSGPAAS
ncbi:hypothetical protein [Paenibacillus sp. NPDC093718]|uniref:hypothetical protein n=1 Tax=Paenibacillus sp. NPDC093718 TaxID=3390601 RepID=UPI003D0060CC